MATVAGTSLFRSVASTSRVASAPPPLHRLLTLRLHSSHPALKPELPAAGPRISSTPPPLPPTNKGMLSAPPLNELGWHSIMRATANASPFLVFGAIMYCGWVKPALQEFRESFAAASRERSEMKENIIQSITDEFQKIRDLLEKSEFMEGPKEVFK